MTLAGSGEYWTRQSGRAAGRDGEARPGARELSSDGHPHHVNVTMVLLCRICSRRLWDHLERIARLPRAGVVAALLLAWWFAWEGINPRIFGPFVSKTACEEILTWRVQQSPRGDPDARQFASRCWEG